MSEYRIVAIVDGKPESVGWQPLVFMRVCDLQLITDAITKYSQHKKWYLEFR